MLWVYTSASVTACRVGLVIDTSAGSSKLLAKFPADAFPCSITFAASTLVTYSTTGVVTNSGSVVLTASAMPTTIHIAPMFTYNYQLNSLTLANAADVLAVHYTGTNAVAYSTTNIFVGSSASTITGANCALRLSVSPAGTLIVTSVNGDLQSVSATPFTCSYTLPTGTLSVTTASGVITTTSPAILTFGPTRMTPTLVSTPGSPTATLTFRKVGAVSDAVILHFTTVPGLGEYDTLPVLLVMYGTPGGCLITLTLAYDMATIVATTPDPTPCSVTLFAANHVALVASYDVSSVGPYLEYLQPNVDVSISLN
jgi:hypothetical protein